MLGFGSFVLGLWIGRTIYKSGFGRGWRRGIAEYRKGKTKEREDDGNREQ